MTANDATGERRLAAILAADVAGYSRLMGADEEGTVAALRGHRHDVIEPLLVTYGGRIANTAGDSFLIEFASAVNALRFAIDVQNAIAARNLDIDAERRLVFRIGINVGDVMNQGDDLLGDGVNVAARLEALASPGGICLSRTTRDNVRDRMDVELDDLGEVTLKNIERPVRAFAVAGMGEGTQVPASSKRAGAAPMPGRRRRVLVAVFAGMALLAGAGIWLGSSPERRPLSWFLPVGDAEASQPSIAVLPFANLSDDEGQAYFADGIVEDITTDLSRISGLHVASHSSTRRFRDASVDSASIAEGLGVKHLLEGSIRRSADQIRITAKLVEAGTGAQLWAERYDRDLQDIFAIQDEIAAKVVDALSKNLMGPALAPVARAYEPKLEAYDLYIHGRAKRIPPTPPNLAAALGMFNKAIEIDPGFAGGYAGAAYVNALIHGLGPALASRIGMPPGDDRLDIALGLAKRAVELDPTFGPAWGALAEVHQRLGDFDDSLEAIRKAVRAAPSDSLMRASLGRILALSGEPRSGIEEVKAAIRMSPDSLPMMFFLGTCYRLAGEFDKAIEALVEHRKRLGGRVIPEPTAQLIAAYAEAGRLEEARAEVARLLEVAPRYAASTTLRTQTYRNPDDARRQTEALVRAGLPR